MWYIEPTPPEPKTTPPHDYIAGAEVVRLSRLNREKDKQIERITNAMVWMAYGAIIAAGVFLHAVRLM